MNTDTIWLVIGCAVSPWAWRRRPRVLRFTRKKPMNLKEGQAAVRLTIRIPDGFPLPLTADVTLPEQPADRPQISAS